MLEFNYKIRNRELKISLKKIRTKNKLIIFNYHQIGHKFDPTRHFPGIFTPTSFFKEQILYLKNNYEIIRLEDGINALKNNQLKNINIAISFDDGDKSCIESMEILEKYNIPATFFINSSYIDNKNSFWFPIYNFIKNNTKYNFLLTPEIEKNISIIRHTKDRDLYLKTSKEIESLFSKIKQDFFIYMTTEDLKQMNSQLFDIGLHGAEHQRFSMISSDLQYQNLINDMKILSSFNNYKKIFAIPFGRSADWNMDTIRIAIELGLDIVFADGGENEKKEVGYKRIPADNRDLRQYI